MALPRHSSDHMKHSSSISDLLAIAEMPSISMTRSRSTPMSLNAMNEGLNDGAGTTNFEEPHVPSLLLNLTSTMLYMTNYYMILPTSSKYLLTLGGKVSSNAAFATNNHNDPAATCALCTCIDSTCINEVTFANLAPPRFLSLHSTGRVQRHPDSLHPSLCSLLLRPLQRLDKQDVPGPYDLLRPAARGRELALRSILRLVIRW